MSDANKTEEEKRDRQMLELLNELRVALPGVQVLFAFLLVVPFQQGFARVTELQKGVYFFCFLCTAVASALLIAPSAYHRIRWRQHDKEQMLTTSNRLAIAGTVFLALGMTATVFLITDVLFASTAAALVAGVTALVFAWFWYGLPLTRRLRE